MTVLGFYDSVQAVTEDDRAKIAAVPFDADTYKARLGVSALYGETGYNTHERAWARPTLEVNGIWGGFTGAGMKTVLPSEAHAKITCRLVADQQPSQIAQLVKAHLERLAPSGVTVNVTIFGNAALPYRSPSDHVGNRAAHVVLEELYGKEPYYTRTGGSVPLLTLFYTELGAQTVTFGFGLPDEAIVSYTSTLNEGGAILSVRCPSENVDEATIQGVLAKYGATNVNHYGSMPMQDVA